MTDAVIAVAGQLWLALVAVIQWVGHAATAVAEGALAVVSVAAAMSVVLVLTRTVQANAGPAPAGVVVGAGSVLVLLGIVLWAHVAHRWWSR